MPLDVLDSWGSISEGPPAPRGGRGEAVDVLGSWTHPALQERPQPPARTAGVADVGLPETAADPRLEERILANRQTEDLSHATARRADWEAAQSPIVGLLGGRAEASQLVNVLHPAIAAALGPAALVATGGAAPGIAAGVKSAISPLARLLTHKGVQYGITATGLETLDQMLGGHITRTLTDLLPRH